MSWTVGTWYDAASHHNTQIHRYRSKGRLERCLVHHVNQIQKGTEPSYGTWWRCLRIVQFKRVSWRSERMVEQKGNRIDDGVLLFSFSNHEDHEKKRGFRDSKVQSMYNAFVSSNGRYSMDRGDDRARNRSCDSSDRDCVPSFTKSAAFRMRTHRIQGARDSQYPSRSVFPLFKERKIDHGIKARKNPSAPVHLQSARRSGSARPRRLNHPVPTWPSPSSSPFLTTRP